MTALLVLLAARPADAADIHLKLATPEGEVSIEEAWPALETLSKKYGPFTIGKVPTVWTLTAQPSVFDALTGAYQASVTSCVKWSVKGAADEHCERYEFAAGATEAEVARISIKAKGLKLDWTVSSWYSGQAPPSGLPAPEPRPVPGE
jgi:hypothetical protein